MLSAPNAQLFIAQKPITQIGKPDIPQWFTFSEACKYCNKQSAKENLIPAYTFVKRNAGIAAGYSMLDFLNKNGPLRPIVHPNSNGYRIPTEREWLNCFEETNGSTQWKLLYRSQEWCQDLKQQWVYYKNGRILADNKSSFDQKMQHPSKRRSIIFQKGLPHFLKIDSNPLTCHLALRMVKPFK